MWREREGVDDPWWNGPDVPEPQAPAVTPPRAQYDWWHDPDTEPPAWMLNPSQPPIQATPGMYWNWSGDHWEQLNAPGNANVPTTQPSAAPSAPNTDTGYLPSSGGGDFGEMSNPNANFQWPTYNGQRMNFGEFGGFKPFAPPSMEQILADPVLQAQLTEGRRGIKQDRAFRGILNTGDTLKDIFDWTADRVKLGANDAFDRAFKVYDVNERQNPFNTWSANRDLAFGTFDRNAPQARDEFLFNQYEPAKATFEDNFRRWSKTGDWLTQLGSQTP